MRLLSSRSLAIALIALVIAGAGVLVWRVESPTTSAPLAQGGDQPTLEQVRDVLRTSAARLQAGDLGGFLKPVTGKARAVLEPVGRGALSLPLAEVDLKLTPGAQVDENASSFQNVPVDLVYRYKGLPDDNYFDLTLSCDIERQGGAWTVTQAAVDPPQGADTPVWVGGPVSVAHSRHFIALSQPGTPDVAETLALAERARANLTTKLTIEQDDVQLLELARDHRELNKIEPSAPPGVLAFVASDTITDGVARGRHMVVDLSTIFGPTSVELHGADLLPPQIVQHELGHLVLKRYDSGATPSIVREAAAMYLSGERRIDSWREGLASKAFDGVSWAALAQAKDLDGTDYAYANASADWLVQTYGAAKFFEFYRSYRYVTVSDPTPALLDRAFGIDESQLDSHTLAYMRAAVANG